MAIWIYLFAFRGAFWRLRERLSHSTNGEDRPLIAVVIPARDEAAVIARTISTLQVQRKVRLHITVADDESSDDTGAAAMAAGADNVVRVTPRPQGWKGKLWALQQGIEAIPAEAEFILFLDADIAFYRDSVVARMLAVSRRGFDLVSVMAHLRCQSPAEQMLIPAFVYFFFKLYPPRWVAKKGGIAAAAGGCMLIRRQAFEKLGGMASYRDALIDDCALAKQVKTSGGRIWLGMSGGDVFSTRGYETAGVIRAMIARSAFTQLGHSSAMLAGAVLGMVVTYLLPVALMFSHDIYSAGAGLAVWLLSTVMYLPTVRIFGAPSWSAMFLPGIALYYVIATVESALNYWRGRGGEWKGRIQDAL